VRAPWKRRGLAFLAGTAACFILVEFGLRVGGWTFTYLRERRNMSALMRADTRRILCLGESTAMSFPGMLEPALGAGFRVVNMARPTIDSTYIAAHAEEQVDKYRPHIVVVMTGINDRATRYYDEIRDSHGILFERSRAYRLARLLWTGWVNKSRQSHSDARSLVMQGRRHIMLGEYARAEDAFQRALALDPRDDAAYAEWGHCEECASRPDRARELFAKALDLNPGNDAAYAGLGRLSLRNGDRTQAVRLWEKGLALNPDNDAAAVDLGWEYMGQGRYALAETLFRKSMGHNPEQESALRRLAVLFDAAGKRALAREFRERADALWWATYGRKTRENYLRLKALAGKRGARLVCVQYPMRSAALLRALFDGEDGRDVVFVDNEGSFREAVKRDGYEAYFMDRFAGDFGHCTPKGDRLLAENIAKAILQAQRGP
jgi:tetratricopeptide (TPR) repeat protein